MVNMQADEAGDSPAPTVPLRSLGAVWRGALQIVSDRDVYQVELVAGTRYLFEMDASAVGALNTAELKLKDAAGTTLQATTDANLATFSYIAPVSGTYYLVAGESGDNGVGSYTVKASAATTPDDVVDTVGATSKALALSSTQSGAIEIVSDRDVYQIELVAGTRYLFEMDASAVGALNTAELKLKDAAGTTLQATTDANLATFSYIAPVSGTYYLVAGESGDNGVGSYTVKADSVVELPNTAQVGGQVYHWKSHVLLGGVALSGVSSEAVASSADGLDIRATEYRAQDHAVILQVWANGPVSVANLDWVVQCDDAAAVSFTSALASDWTLATQADSPASLSVGAFAVSAVTGPFQVGTLKIDLNPGVAHASIHFTQVTVGNTAVLDQQVSVAAASSSVAGAYTLAGLPLAAVDLAASRAATDSASAITSADALAALRIAVGLNPNPDPDGASGPLSALKVSPYQYIAADVNKDGKITSADALAILRMAVKAPTALGQEWLFVNESKDLWNETTATSSLTKTNAAWDAGLGVGLHSDATVNLVAVLKGDVNGSWAAPTGSTDLDVTNPTYFQLLGTQLGVPTDVWGV
jgi:hypothetical protein